jgi:hypothetical protein
LTEKRFHRSILTGIPVAFLHGDGARRITIRVRSAREEMHMTRLTLVLIAWMTLISAAPASLTPRKELPPPPTELPRTELPRLPAKAAEGPTQPRRKTEYVLTERTEVLVNGQPCRYADVPANATIVRMELAADEKTVLRIHFRVRK